MQKRKSWFVMFILLLMVLPACAPFLPTPLPTPIPGYINTAVVLTSQAAASQTAAAQPPATATVSPTTTPRPVTATPSPTETVLFDFVTATPLTPTMQPPPDAWPAWNTGEVTRLPQGSGENVGALKYFRVLANVKVKVIRENGVKLRLGPSSEAGTNLKAKKGDRLILLGYWNKNFGQSYVKVRTEDGKEYWVGGNEDAIPEASLDFVR